MENLIIHQTKDVFITLNGYSEKVSDRLFQIRQLILDTAEEIESISSIEETLKWGQASYISKEGTTIRIAGKTNTADKFAIYVPCTTTLVTTAKATFGTKLTYEGTRAIVFSIHDKLPMKILKKFIKAALMYHSFKNLESLGME